MLWGRAVKRVGVSVCPFYNLQQMSVAASRGVDQGVGVIDERQKQRGGEPSLTTVPPIASGAHLGVCAFSCNYPL